MRILYGVCGEGMGHATRTKVTLAHLTARGHQVLVVASDQALRVLGSPPGTAGAAAVRTPPSSAAAPAGSFRSHPSYRVLPIVGFGMRCKDGALDLRGTLEENAQRLPRMLMENASAWAEAEVFQPDIVVTDVEPFTWLYASAHGLPLVSIDNAQILPRCIHLTDVLTPQNLTPLQRSHQIEGLRALEMLTAATAQGASHYIITTFFYPPVKPALRTTTTIVPPILRSEVLDHFRPASHVAHGWHHETSPRVISDHVLVYKTGSLDDAAILAPLAQIPEQRFVVYGLRDVSCELPSNVLARPYNTETFLADLASAQALVSNGGMSLIGEALAFGTPIYAVPVRGQFEQVLNACYLERLGYGVTSDDLDPRLLRTFLANRNFHERMIRRQPQHDENRQLYGTLDRLFPV